MKPGLRRTDRFEVKRVEGAQRGDLYELERRIRIIVNEKSTGTILYSFDGLMEASLNKDTGRWDDCRYSGVSDVFISEDERSVIGEYHDNKIEEFPLAAEEKATDPEP